MSTHPLSEELTALSLSEYFLLSLFIHVSPQAQYLSTEIAMDYNIIQIFSCKIMNIPKLQWKMFLIYSLKPQAKIMLMGWW